MIMKIQHQIRRITVAAVGIVAVALMSGCTTMPSQEKVLQQWAVGENKVMALIRGIKPLNPVEYEPTCKQGKLPTTWGNHASLDEQKIVSAIQRDVCPNISEWRTISGFIKSDFRNGALLAVGLIPPGLNVDVDDIVETTLDFSLEGRATRPDLVTRVIRKNALKERDPTCYWDGQSGRFDAFATGGVVCPAEGWDWREQKWAKK
jgi:hypothetical protein